MINLQLKKYALALFKVAQESNKINILNNNIESFRIELEKINPTIIENLRVKVVDKAKLINVLNIVLDSINADNIFVSFIKLLVMNNQINLIGSFLYNWDDLYKNFNGYERVELITADPLLPEEEEEIKSYLINRYGEKFFIKKIVDKSIIAGLIVRAKDFEFNDSILGKLNNLTKNFKKGAV